MELNREVAQKVLTTVDAGLCRGVGKPIPGQMCVEAAVCYALGQPHGDEPQCVGAAVRAYKIKLNDSNWSDDKARAKGMRRVAIAQLGSDEIDQNEFRKEVVIGTVKQLLPIALRAAAKMVPAHAEALEAAAVLCGAVVSFTDARSAAQKSREAPGPAYAAADAADAKRDSVLAKAAEIAVQALIKLGSKGAQWLDLCDAA